jgi:hypothetical protein
MKSEERLLLTGSDIHFHKIRLRPGKINVETPSKPPKQVDLKRTKKQWKRVLQKAKRIDGRTVLPRKRYGGTLSSKKAGPIIKGKAE